jgi:sulfate adenylyltransferase subunit 1
MLNDKLFIIHSTSNIYNLKLYKMDLLKFFTAGNVDDGKSTLIGRLLLDSNSISTDIIDTLTQQSKIKGTDTGIDLALLTDGLRAEREQGITIDVAYKYFSSPKRKFIIADTPGHIQYTRNMFTGASNAQLAIILVDARNGITEQTRRHTILSNILRVNNVLVCINKMDMVNYSEDVFNEIKRSYIEFSKSLQLTEINFIPVSALAGDNVVNTSGNLAWYKGSTLLQYLETVDVSSSQNNNLSRFQVQYVIRPQTAELHDYRGYAGSVLNGSFKKGQKILIIPGLVETEIEKIEHHQNEINEANAGMPIVIHIKNDVDISRGYTFVPLNEGVQVEKEFNATICWMDNADFNPSNKFILQHNSLKTKAAIKLVHQKIDVNTNLGISGNTELKLNDIAKVSIKTASDVAFDFYRENKNTGAFILINETTNNTVAAGVIE